MKNDMIWMIVTGFISAVATDYSAFWKAKQNDPDATYDWGLSLKRAFLGVLSGGGISAILAGGA